ncbi:MAG: phosphate signaling complex protein PhoU [Erysipelotrichaceae bacterium]|nr:phosphate signaling complex protein PhoU [Erysipelotrichaceae bacterium]MDD3809137.1 phosphate signaling complex protein PhoU [Erysipelotrichaceae bacterium]
MLRSSFLNDLNQLKVDLNKMCYLVIKQLENGIDAFKNDDKELAKTVILKDKEVNDMERKIEAACLNLILRQQPIARDLRDISTALKIVTDLERIGDQIADICETIIRLNAKHAFKMVEDIPEMAEIATKMVRDAIQSFNDNDIILAKEVKLRDDRVDELFNNVKLELVEITKNAPDQIDACIEFTIIAKYLERIGDHAVNICEWTEFQETGEMDHTRLI